MYSRPRRLFQLLPPSAVWWLVLNLSSSYPSTEREGGGGGGGETERVCVYEGVCVYVYEWRE